MIQLVLNSGWTAAAACREFNIKMTTGCLIIRNYKKEQRIFHKPGMGGPHNHQINHVGTSKNRRKSTREERYETRRAKSESEKETVRPEEVVEEAIKIEAV